MAQPFTPEQVAQILEEFFKVVGTRQYVGARYVPIFGRKDETSILWDNSAPYEPLTIVLYQGNSYTSRQYVPTGVDILNQEFWALTGNYNAQVEAYRTEVLQFSDEIADATDKANAAMDGVERIDAALPSTDFDADNTVKDAIDSIGTVLPLDQFTAQSTVKDQMDGLRTELNIAIDDVADALPLTAFNRDHTVATQIATIIQGAERAYEVLDNVTDAMPLSSFSAEHTIEDAIENIDDVVETVITPLRDTVEHDSIFNKKYVGKTVAPVVDGTWYSYYNNERFYPQALCVLDNNVYIGARNTDDTRYVAVNASRSGNNFAWTREFSNSHIGHFNSMAWDSLRNRFMISGAAGYGIRVADAAFNTVSSADTLWPFTTWAGRIAFDRVTNWGYVIDDGNDPSMATRRLYCLEPNEGSFRYFCEIEVPSSALQDICVRDDTMFVLTTANSWLLFHIDRDAATCERIEYGTFSGVDSNELYYFGESEGCDFDSNGELYVSFTCATVTVVTRIPYEGEYIPPISRSTFQIVNATISPDYRNAYRNLGNQLKTINELSVRAYKSMRTVTYNGTIREHGTAYLKDVCIIVDDAANVTFDTTLQCVGGIVTFVNLGTITCSARELFVLTGTPGLLVCNFGDDSSSSFTSSYSRLAYETAATGALIYVHSVPSNFTGKINSTTAHSKTLYGFAGTITTF